MYKEFLPELNEFLRRTWKGLQVSVEYKYGDDFIEVQVRDGDFSVEIKNYGSGLQMWIQILWFLCKIHEEDSIVVLDEPDVYIHADLQRKLFRLVADTYSQVIIATHSIEIINEANISSIIMVDKKKKRFSFCREKAFLEQAVKSIGTTQNIMLTKLQRHNKCLFVEGNDVDILDDIFKLVINDQSKSIKDFAINKLGGKDHYQESFGAADLLSEDTSGTFRTFCLLDRDYNDKYNEQITRDAENHKIELYILEKLEIENYLIIPRIFAEITHQNIELINRKIYELAEELKDETFDRILQEKFSEYRKIPSGAKVNLAKISKETRDFMADNWNTLENIISIVPGKELKGKIFDWIKTEYKISLSDKKIIQRLQISDIPSGLIEFLKKLNS